jgi:hypothetical protein
LCFKVGRRAESGGKAVMGKKRGKGRRLVAPRQERSPKGSETVPVSTSAGQRDGLNEPLGTTSVVDDLAHANLRLTQWMVKWTAALAIVGVLTTIVGGVSVGVAYVQWKALLKTDSTTREAFTAVQRPFIVATDLEVIQDLPLYWSFRTILENTGSTPTKNMTVTSSVSFSVPILPDSPTDPLELTRQPNDPYPSVTDHFVGPRGKVGIEVISLITKTLEEMAEQRADFYVYGIARYNDNFAETQARSTKFCFVVRPFKGPNGLTLNNRGLCHHWNCGDEDCDRDRRKYEAERNEVLRQNPKVVEISRPVPIAAIIPFYPTPVIKAQ